MSYRCYDCIEDQIEPVRPYHANNQQWQPTLKNPRPNNFTQAPSPNHQLRVYYNGKPQLQTLSPSQGPQMFPIREINENPTNSYDRKHSIYPHKSNAIVYPTTHSIPGPYLQSYIRMPNKYLMY